MHGLQTRAFPSASSSVKIMHSLRLLPQSQVARLISLVSLVNFIAIVSSAQQSGVCRSSVVASNVAEVVAVHARHTICLAFIGFVCHQHLALVSSASC